HRRARARRRPRLGPRRGRQGHLSQDPGLLPPRRSDLRKRPFMTDPFTGLAPANIEAIVPYEPGKPVEELERELGVRDAIKLASNENPIGPSPLAVAAAQAALPGVNRYPDGSAFRLRSALAEHA